MFSDTLLPANIPACPNAVAEYCSGFFLLSDCPAAAKGNRATKRQHIVTTDDLATRPTILCVWLVLIGPPPKLLSTNSATAYSAVFQVLSGAYSVIALATSAVMAPRSFW